MDQTPGTNRNGVVFKMIGHACVLATYGDQSVLFDPWFGRPSSETAFSGYPKFESLSNEDLRRLIGIHVSHIHFDHMDRRDIRELPEETPVVIANYIKKDFLSVIRATGRKSVIEVDPGETFHLSENFSITIFPKVPQDGTFDSSCVLSVAGKHFYFANDCLHFDTTYNLIRHRFGKMHGAFLGYAVANPFTWGTDLSECEGLNQPVSVDELARERQSVGWSHVAKACHLLQPEWAVPYASSYRFLNPDLAHLNRLFGVDEQIFEINLGPTKPVVLKHGELFEGATGTKLTKSLESRALTSPVVPENLLNKTMFFQNIPKEEWPGLLERLEKIYLDVFNRQRRAWTTTMKIETAFYDEFERHSMYFEFNGDLVLRRPSSDVSFEWADVVFEMPASIANEFASGKRTLFDTYYLFSQKLKWRRLKYGQMNFLSWV